jgi:hypothetical protein
MRLLPLALLILAVPALAQEPPPSPSRTRYLEHYAGTYGVSVEEAERRQRDRWEIVDLDKRLKAERPGTYAGLLKEHVPEYRVVVQFTRDPEATLRRYTRNPLFVARAAPLSLAELGQAHEEAIRVMRASGIRYASDSDIRTGRIKVVVEDPIMLERLRAAGTVPLAPEILIVQAAGPFGPLPPEAPGTSAH